MPDCIVCGAYTKFNNGKCTDCYNNKYEDVDDILDKILDDDKGLTEKEWNYRYSMIKGRIAETLVQELFLSMGYNVFHYGMENTIPGIMELLRGVRGDVAKQIRRMPDFVIQHRQSKKVFFIEVKFRANENFAIADLAKDYPYENAHIVVVSKKHIKCLSVGDLRAGKAISPDCHHYLGYIKEFDLDKDVIKQFCEFAVKFFAEV